MQPEQHTAEAVTVSHLWWRYPTYSEKANPWILRDISLHIDQGECFGITGPSGAGKSTLCRIFMGILPYTARLTTQQLPHYFRGSVTLLNEPLSAGTASARHIGMVQQD